VVQSVGHPYGEEYDVQHACDWVNEGVLCCVVNHFQHYWEEPYARGAKYDLQRDFAVLRGQGQEEYGTNQVFCVELYDGFFEPVSCIAVSFFVGGVDLQNHFFFVSCLVKSAVVVLCAFQERLLSICVVHKKIFG
jgi:hypothetical protein